MPRDDDADYSRYVNGGDSDNHYDYDDCDDYYIVIIFMIWMMMMEKGGRGV